MAKPTIILVHGFWGNSLHWQHVIPLLVDKDFEVKAIEIPLTSLADDIERTNKMINQVEGPVLLVGHSYGGAVITEAGNNEKVVGLVYIAAFAPDKGESAGSLTGQNPPEAISAIEGDSDGYLWLKVEEYNRSFCQDLRKTDTIAMAHAQKAPLANSFNDTIEHPAWKKKPSWYQISSNDRMISPVNQKNMANRLKAKMIIELDASHASLISKANEVAKIIMEAAETF
ncbi:alpha/beta hydrolase [Bartonella sp. HY329]|uniref:alpha/beta hydrolase n=1 Tax=unclassified Bartonella TaxID=2645622 RepID=UPI0021C6D45A|nr:MULTISPECIES: alpha/beta hydrolase [unclassified Bartonella]UXM94372.1 alpha/beta hydrolase [Bartonella sp. HY329]UXN08695.1 alpha/beta hydrolase [Bartonella sp. HY328]